MRKWMIVLAVFTIALTIGSKNASAQSTIGFGDGTSTGQVTFVSNGNGTAAVTLGTCSGGSCTLSGSNTGGGTFSLVTGGAIQTGIIGSGGGLSVKMAGSPTSAFTYVGSGGTLTGTITWANLTLDGKSVLSGVLTVSSNTTTITLGPESLIDISTNGYAHDISTYIYGGLSGATEGATVSTGQITPTPEPSSIFFFGTGLLALGGILRRRLLA